MKKNRSLHSQHAHLINGSGLQGVVIVRQGEIVAVHIPHHHELEPKVLGICLRYQDQLLEVFSVGQSHSVLQLPQVISLLSALSNESGPHTIPLLHGRS